MFLPSALPAKNGFVKICGVCNADDAQLCSRLGANAIGMLLTKADSPRKPGSDRLERFEAAELVESLPSGLMSVLLVHTVNPEEIFELASQIKPSALQIQCAVDIDALLRVKDRLHGQSIIKTFSVKSSTSLSMLEDEIQMYVDRGAIDAVLLDSAHGGSGDVHDWEISAKLVAQLAGTRVILAGGLKAENVAAARRIVHPYGVDVMSGVNSSGRRDRKDPDRLRDFVKAWHESSDR